MLSPASPTQPEAPHRRGALQRVLESLTLLTLLAAVSFYLVGRLFSLHYLQSFGQSDLWFDQSWETAVFKGFAASINTLTNLDDPTLRGWVPRAVITLVTGLGARAAFRRIQRPWLRWPLSLAAGYLCLAFYLGTLIHIGMGWGLHEARLRVRDTGRRDHFVFQEGTRAVFPESLFKENEAGDLRVIQEFPEFVLLASSDRQRVYRIPTREIRLHEIRLPARP